MARDPLDARHLQDQTEMPLDVFRQLRPGVVFRTFIVSYPGAEFSIAPEDQRLGFHPRP